MKPCNLLTGLMKKPLIMLGLSLFSLYSSSVHAQNNAVMSAREQAPIDLSGTWVSLVTEHWRYRIITADAGEVSGYDLTDLGLRMAENWDPAVDTANGEACKSYGAAGIMRQPTRLQISWENQNILRIDTDAGMQTRLLKFGPAQDGTGAGTWQGVSNAQWKLHGQNGTLEVETRNMRPGYLLRNGIPYSDQAVLEEYFELIEGADGAQYLVVVSIVNDPVFLAAPAITSSNFRREADSSGWSPEACIAD